MVGTFDPTVVWVALEPNSPEDAQRLDDVLRRLAEEDPRVRARAGEAGQTILAGISEAHLVSAIDRLRREFTIAAAVSRIRVAYKEILTTIAEGQGRFVRQSGERGQYGHVKIRVGPLPAGGGYRFTNQVADAVLPERFIAAASEGIQSALVRGVVAGSPIEDVAVDIIDGSYHETDSSETAFIVAGGLALTDAAKKANPVLTEPVMRVRLLVPERYLAAVTTDLTRRNARLETRGPQGGLCVVHAFVPLSGLLGYEGQLQHMTSGRGTCSMFLDCYEPVRQDPSNGSRGARTSPR
jgi:elongation factor G